MNPRIIILLFFCPLFLKAQVKVDTLDSFIENQVIKNGFEGTILLADQGRIIYQNSFGYKDRSTGEQITNETHFAIASVTKMFTAIAILQLIEEGDLLLEEKVRDILPEFELPGKNQITVHDLLLHISGLPNEPDSFFRERMRPEKFVKMTLRGGDIRSKYGTFNYANIDYILLGLILEKRTGDSWEGYISDRILKTAGMSNTGFLKENNFPKDFANTYTLAEDGKLKRDRGVKIENYWSSGSMYATASDLLKLDQALHTNVLLSEESKRLMSRSYPEYNYTGYGVWNYRYPFLESKPLIMERRGGIYGANVVLVRFPELNRTIIILSNNNRFNPDSFGDASNLREAIIRLMGQ